MTHTISIFEAGSNTKFTKLWLNVYEQITWECDTYVECVDKFLATYDAIIQFNPSRIEFHDGLRMAEFVLKWG